MFALIGEHIMLFVQFKAILDGYRQFNESGEIPKLDVDWNSWTNRKWVFIINWKKKKNFWLSYYAARATFPQMITLPNKSVFRGYCVKVNVLRGLIDKCTQSFTHLICRSMLHHKKHSLINWSKWCITWTSLIKISFVITNSYRYQSA